MPEIDDHHLLENFGRTQSETAFATLTERYVNLVYSTALRSTGNPHHAEEITQAVFVILARKASQLSPRMVLSGWLYQTVRLTAANFLKSEFRRQRREQEATVQSESNEPSNAAWQEIAPLLDEAMGQLSPADRDAVVLRFFQNRTAAEMAVQLHLSDSGTNARAARWKSCASSSSNAASAPPPRSLPAPSPRNPSTPPPPRWRPPPPPPP